MTGASHGRAAPAAIFLERLHERGDRPAVLALHKGRYGALVLRRACRLARRLSRGLAGVGSGDHVALFAANRPEWVLACLAVVEAGAVAVPLDAQIDDEMLAHPSPIAAPNLSSPQPKAPGVSNTSESRPRWDLSCSTPGKTTRGTGGAFSRTETKRCRRLCLGWTTKRRCSTPPGGPARQKAFP